MKERKGLYSCIKKVLVPILAVTLVFTSALLIPDGLFSGSVAYAAGDTVRVTASLQIIDSTTTDKVELTVSISENADALSGIQMRIIYPEEFDIIETTDCDFFGNGISFFGEDGANPMYCSFGSHGADGEPSESTTRTDGDLVKFTFEANQILNKGTAYTFGIEEKDSNENITLEAFVLTTGESGNPCTNYLNVVDASPELSYTPTIVGGSVGEGENANTITAPVISNESGINKYVIKQQAVEEALKAGKDIVIDASNMTPVPKAQLVISKESTEIVGNSDKALTVATDAGRLTFDNPAIKNIGNKGTGDNLVIYVEKSDTVKIGSENKDAVDFEVTAALVDTAGITSTPVTEFGGGEVEVALDLPASLQREEVMCWNYTDTNYTPINGAVKNNQFVFTTSHFSKYIVAERATLEAFKEAKCLSEGVKVSGTAVSWNSTDNARYRLYPDSTEDAAIKNDIKRASSGITGSVEPDSKGTIAANADGKRFNQTFSFDGIATGTYKLAVYKPGKYVPMIINIHVTSVGVTEDLSEIDMWLYGDVTYDGIIDVGDVIQIKRKIIGLSSSIDTYGNLALEVANVTFINDTDLDVGDVIQIERYIIGLSSSFDSIK